ncbi:MAG: hypothetical protein EOM83_06020 [Clostridia bacterium]|nr:hypothetical protein [Clostridia bacterium]
MAPGTIEKHSMAPFFFFIFNESAFFVALSIFIKDLENFKKSLQSPTARSLQRFLSKFVVGKSGKSYQQGRGKWENISKFEL